MEYVAAAMVIVAALAWDIARRWLQPRKQPDLTRLNQVEENMQALAVDLLKTDKVVKNLAEDWKAKFTQLEAASVKLEKDLTAKVGGTVATLLPSRGYNRG